MSEAAFKPVALGESVHARQARRLAIVLSHPTQYYSPWFRWLAAHTDLTLRVFYLWDFGVTRQHDPKFATSFRWDVDLTSGYDHEWVPNTARDPGTHHFHGLTNPELTPRLEAWRPDALLLFGYNWSSHRAAIRWANDRRVPLLFRGDSHFLGRGKPWWPKSYLLRSLYRRFTAFLPVGAVNRDYFITLGVPDEKLFFAPHAVNHEWFDPLSEEHRAKAAAVRASLGIAADAKVVLFAGKFVPEKQPRELLSAFVALQPANAALVYVGDGPERSALQAAAEAAGSTMQVRFLPFANQTEMPSRYLLADLFVLPSRGHYETWGLAVNEAMHMGVPALVSDVVGCQRDLVTPGETGWVFRHADPSGLRDQLRSALFALSDPTAARALRERVRARIAGYTYPRATAGLMAALTAACRR